MIVKAKIQKKIINLRHDKVYKNSLLVMRYKLAYLDFVDVCKKVYGTWAQKCIKYFVILFQSSNATNYTQENIYLVTCFKYI